MPISVDPLPVLAPQPDETSIEALADALADKKRVMLWLGGGARHATDPVARLANLGFGVVTSVQGRGVLPGDDHQSLGAFNLQPAAEEFYSTCDAMLVVGSRLRSNETLTYKLRLPDPLYQIDADPRAEGRAYPVDMFICGDSAISLEHLADQLKGRFTPDKGFTRDIQGAREGAKPACAERLAPITKLSMRFWTPYRAISFGYVISPCRIPSGAIGCRRSTDRGMACMRWAAASDRACQWE